MLSELTTRKIDIDEYDGAHKAKESSFDFIGTLHHFDMEIIPKSQYEAAGLIWADRWGDS